jgi:hypothetical protein
LPHPKKAAYNKSRRSVKVNFCYFSYKKFVFCSLFLNQKESFMHLKNLLYTFLLFWIITPNIQAQCPPSSPGFLSGTTTNMLPTDTTAVPVFTTVPSGLPNTEFVLIQRDSLAVDGFGPVILTSTLDGRVVPADFGLTTTCNELCLVPFSYDLVQLQSVVDSLINGQYIPGTSCCDAAGQFFVGLCDSLANYGIFSGSDITSLNDVIVLMGVFAGTTNTSISLNGFISTIQQLNVFASLFGNCAANNTEICFSVSNTDLAMDCYLVALPNSSNFVDIMQDTVRIPPNGSVFLMGTYLPNSSIDSLSWSISNSSSSLVVDPITGEVTAGTISDTAWVVLKANRGCLTDVAVVIVDPTLTVSSLNITEMPLQTSPNPFQKSLEVTFYAKEGSYNVQLIAVTGQVVYQKEYNLNTGNQQLEINDYSIPEGYYFLKITGKEMQGTQAVLKY